MPIDSHRSYLDKHRFAPRQIQKPPPPFLAALVVIPVHQEPDLFPTLLSLENSPSNGEVEVLLVFNSSEKHPNDVRNYHENQIAEIENWASLRDRLHNYHCLHFPNLPSKHAGVGLARKIGMDEAVDRLEQVNNPAGIIICLDGDTTVAPDYLETIQDSFSKNTEAISLGYAHPLEGDAHSTAVYKGIMLYELFLRYYVEGLRFAGFPYAYHTIGSAMAVRSSAYQKRGGMNRRKAGEDFYFLHKFIPQGGFREVTKTKVYPSPRPSERVPFGTGKAINKWLEGEQNSYPVYAPATFIALKALLDQVPDLYRRKPVDLPPLMQAYCEAENLEDQLQKIRENVGQASRFPKRFYQWFDGLKALQFVHYAREHFLEEVEITQAVQKLWALKYNDLRNLEPGEWLKWYRRIQDKPWP